MRIFTVLVFMAAAAALGQTARLGDLGPDSTVVTNAVPGGVVVESDPVAYPVATNALALASTALQPGATNGLLTAEVDPVAAPHIASTANPHGVTAAQVGAIPSDGGFVYGPLLMGNGTYLGFATNTHVFISDGDASGNVWTFRDPTTARTRFLEFAATDDLLDYATWQGATNAAAAAVAGSGHAIAEQVVSGAVGTAESGYRYFWTSATNVVLSVNLTSGQVVNLAKLNNTATNSIAAIGQVGWEWTGGDATNTIAAGKSMTFGFLVDPATGRTNAYATGVSK